MRKIIECVMAAVVILLVIYSASLSGRAKTPEDEMRDKMMSVACTRCYADSTGESHLEDVVKKLHEANFAPPAPPLLASEFLPAFKYGLISGAPGWVGEWHPAPKRQIMFYLQGQVEAEVSDGTVRRFGPGSVILVEDTFGKGHRSRVVGDDDVLIAVVQVED